MTQEKEIVNKYDYIYDKDQVIAINGNALLSFMTFLEQVVEKEPKIAALRVYPKETSEIRDEKGELVKVEVNWEEHNPNSFFFTAADNNGGVPIMTEIALKAEQLLHAFTLIHQENINNKIAKKQQDINAANIFKA